MKVYNKLIRDKIPAIMTDKGKRFVTHIANQQEYEQKLNRCNVSEVTKYLEEGHFGVGSMEPKIKSAIYFLEYYGKKVVLTSLNKLEDALKGNSGTIITKD